jgi:hypothetical protein
MNHQIKKVEIKGKRSEEKEGKGWGGREGRRGEARREKEKGKERKALPFWSKSMCISF